MSYDIDLIDKNTKEPVESFNITYNVSKMFYSCWPEKGIRNIYGMSGEDSLEHLLHLHKHLLINREEMLQYEPANRWGTWENTVKCINKMCMAAAENPKCVWEGD
jgi:hypothetical protein